MLQFVSFSISEDNFKGNGFYSGCRGVAAYVKQLSKCVIARSVIDN